MKRLLLPLVFLAGASCQTLGIPTPWLTSEEVDAVAAYRVDELEVAVEDAVGIEIERTMTAEPPVRDTGTDWGELIVLALTALTGSAGALGYRAWDHSKKRKRTGAAA